MARYTGPQKKLERRFGLLEDEKSQRSAKKFGRKSEYGLALEEKQKLKFIYDIKEKQLRRYVQDAMLSKENPGEKLLMKIQTRLDNVVYLLGFAATRRQARQFVNHGHIFVSGKKIDIPSYNVKSGEKIEFHPSFLENPTIQEILKETEKKNVPSWLTRAGTSGQIISIPTKEELPQDINPTLIIEFYSR